MEKQSFNAPPHESEIGIVQKLFDFYKILHGLVIKFPKAEKHTLGQTIANHTLTMLEIVVVASKLPTGKDKKDLLTRAGYKLEMVKLLVRMSFEIKAISDKQYCSMQECLQEIGRMLGGWIRSLK